MVQFHFLDSVIKIRTLSCLAGSMPSCHILKKLLSKISCVVALLLRQTQLYLLLRQLLSMTTTACNCRPT